MRTLFVGAAVGASVLAASVPAFATDYYVSTSGNDGNTGLSGQPWATLQHAADTVAAGDTVHVANGNYVGFNLETGGTQISPIVFIAEGDAVQITSDNGTTTDGINVEQADWVTIDGFIVN